MRNGHRRILWTDFDQIWHTFCADSDGISTTRDFDHSSWDRHSSWDPLRPQDRRSPWHGLNPWGRRNAWERRRPSDRRSPWDRRRSWGRRRLWDRPHQWGRYSHWGHGTQPMGSPPHMAACGPEREGGKGGGGIRRGGGMRTGHRRSRWTHFDQICAATLKQRSVGDDLGSAL